MDCAFVVEGGGGIKFKTQFSKYKLVMHMTSKVANTRLAGQIHKVIISNGTQRNLLDNISICRDVNLCKISPDEAVLRDQGIQTHGFEPLDESKQ